MFSGFWSWVLVIVLVVAIFSADKLPDLKKFIEKSTKDGLEAAKKGAKNVEEKIAKVKAEKEKKNETGKNPEDEE